MEIQTYYSVWRLHKRLFKSAHRQRWKIPADQRTTVTLSLSDDDFANLASGKTQAQRLFMSGKLKIKGDVMKVGLGSRLFEDSFADGCLVGYKNGTSA